MASQIFIIASMCQHELAVFSYSAYRRHSTPCFAVFCETTTTCLSLDHTFLNFPIPQILFTLSKWFLFVLLCFSIYYHIPVPRQFFSHHLFASDTHTRSSPLWHLLLLSRELTLYWLRQFFCPVRKTRLYDYVPCICKTHFGNLPPTVLYFCLRKPIMVLVRWFWPLFR